MPAAAYPLSAVPLEEIESLAARYDRPGPRYTSYPTAAQFTESFGAAQYAQRLLDAASKLEDPLSVYVHIPFCSRRCTYCGCHVVATAKGSLADAYLDHLEKEARLVTGFLGSRRPVRVVHLGGGTPTFLSPAQLERLFDILDETFPKSFPHEASVEIDPRVTREEHLRALKARGVNRVSLGVQDLDAGVQEAIGRNQTAEEAESVFRLARRLRFESINLDLVYGLPRQTLESFKSSIRRAIALRPDRAALYGYAHVPWMRPNQRGIDESTLPGAADRLHLFLAATELFVEAGYVQVGMDHFALPGDQLARALRARRLGRNFMGYSPHAALETIGLGVSAIGRVAGAYVQNVKGLAAYYRLLDEGKLPVERGYASTDEDELRRHAIQELLSNFRLDLRDFEARAGAPFESRFEEEMEELRESERAGLITFEPGAIEVTPLGRLFLRNVVMPLDRHNRGAAAGSARFSRTV